MPGCGMLCPWNALSATEGQPRWDGNDEQAKLDIPGLADGSALTLRRQWRSCFGISATRQLQMVP